MRIMILFNPIAGVGKAALVARQIGSHLGEFGYEIDLVESRPDPSGDWLDRRLQDTAVMAVVGGDGAVQGASGPAIRTSTPIYHVPYGTENLFAREFGMDPRPETLLRAVQRYEVRQVDVGIANDQPFLLMASIGFDAAVVHDLAARRGSSISHLSYARPILRQLGSWRPPRLTVTVDGRPLAPDGAEMQKGCVIVANSRQYAWRLNPARRAVMSDGLFDVLFFPVRSTADLLGWILKFKLGRPLADPRLRYQLGRDVEIVCDQPQLVQLDGDPPPGGVGKRTSQLRASVRPRALGVLMP